MTSTHDAARILMKRTLIQKTLPGCAAILVIAAAAGCATNTSSSDVAAAPTSTSVQAKPVAAAPSASQAQTAAPAIRINAGASSSVTNSNGHVWQADKGFQGGDVIERPDIQIANTQQPDLYRSEHYGMESFSWDVPNGKYLAKLHFAETFEGIYGAGERVFSFSVHGREFKNFDVWAKAGGANRAYVESVPVEVTDGKFRIVFTPNIENPQINAVELIPQ